VLCMSWPLAWRSLVASLLTVACAARGAWLPVRRRRRRLVFASFMVLDSSMSAM
jgi:hypothetical protein